MTFSGFLRLLTRFNFAAALALLAWLALNGPLTRPDVPADRGAPRVGERP